jgi:hypothetical protein
MSRGRSTRQLPDEDSKELLANARNAVGKKSPAVSIAVKDEAGSKLYPSRDAAIRALTEQSDQVIGRGKRTLALLQHAESWLTINEEHPEAKKVFDQLRSFSRNFNLEFLTLRNTYRLNENKLHKDDI